MQTNNLNFNKKKAQQVGFSLIELLVAMVISLTLIFACTALYSSLKGSMTTAQSLATAQESLRGTFYLMSRSVYQADSVSINGANDELTVTYNPPPTGQIYSCLGNAIASAATDTYSSDGTGLYCDDDGIGTGSAAELIALDIQSLNFTTISDASGTVNGLTVTIKIEGMPASLSDGLTFTLALRQKILLDLAQ
ncbi:Type IV pili fiber-building block protein [Psychromonas ingrahamii 37]|uniref:Type IV pili fiber-building block protein n=1 Tax=Psychromonas ingrahamii (strain DSM 17664 / CCUG 51855 / 37) TaxID=357804 RepID=A1SZM4_PSYIN|nr:prepilin-type N-terminal cleavage/methylation domain-containing protein [Psychromonas ingrahamii]ABM04939.1 Type IV pili fiber-building block protein [Psychromonas ingrahamii 37]